MAYTTVDSPIGPLFVASTDKGLVRLWFGEPPDSHAPASWRVRVSPRVIEAPAKLDPVRRQLDEYFEGARTHFDLPLDWSLSHGFGQRVLEATNRIPYGQVSTYGTSPTRPATRRPAGPRAAPSAPTPSPSSSRATASSAPSGSLTGYGGGMAAKEYLLRLEGYLPQSRSDAATYAAQTDRVSAGRRRGPRRPRRPCR